MEGLPKTLFWEQSIKRYDDRIVYYIISISSFVKLCLISDSWLVTGWNSH